VRQKQFQHNPPRKESSPTENVAVPARHSQHYEHILGDKMEYSELKVYCRDVLLRAKSKGKQANLDLEQGGRLHARIGAAVKQLRSCLAQHSQRGEPGLASVLNIKLGKKLRKHVAHNRARHCSTSSGWTADQAWVSCSAPRENNAYTTGVATTSECSLSFSAVFL
jgi:hypothetical protein